MMNMVQVVESLKTVPDQYLVQAIQGQNPNAPGYLALAEMQRRQSLRQQGGAQQPPTSTVAQDEVRQTMAPQMPPQGMPQQMPQQPQQTPMGIGGVKGYADGGKVTPTPYGGIYGGENLLPDTTGYEGWSMSDILADLAKKAGTKVSDFANWTGSFEPPGLPEYRTKQGQRMQGYVPRYTGPGGPVWHVGQQPSEAPTGPEAPIPDVSIQQPAGQPGGIGSISASARTRTGGGIGGRGATIPDQNIPEAPDIGQKDPTEFLNKVPPNKILEQLAQEVAVNKEKYADQRKEIKNAAMARFGAMLATKPGGFGAAFAPAIVGASDFQRGALKDVDVQERQAEMDRRAVLLAQAANEQERYKAAADLSRDDYNARVNDYARKFGVTKERAEIAIRQAQLQNAVEVANIQANATMNAASMRVSAGSNGAIIRAFSTAQAQAGDKAKADLSNPLTLIQMQRKYGTKNVDEIRSRLTKDYYETAVRSNPFLSQYADEMGLGAPAPATPTGPSFVTPPQGATIRR